MPEIIDKKVHLDFPLGHHLHCMVAQIPNHLIRGVTGFQVAAPEEKWHLVSSILDLVVSGEGNLKKLHFLLFPESSIPMSRFDEMLAVISQGFRANTVVVFGVEHISLRNYRAVLERFRDDNSEAIALVDTDIEAGDVLDMPVNWCCTAVKEHDGRLRVFIEAKSHPFHGEEYVDVFRDLYRGRHFYLFRSFPACFNFMAIICLDYLYRSLYTSNIRQIIDHANNLYFTTRQRLDALFVIQCNPKPEHGAYHDTISGFYGEYLEDLPGVREAVTVFANVSAETTIEGYRAGENTFGSSYVVVNRNHRLTPASFAEFAIDNFSGAPVCRLKFANHTRLLYFNLPPQHELDPRSARVSLKVHAVLSRDDKNQWHVIPTDELPEMQENEI